MIYNSFCIVGMIRLELTTTRPPDVYANQLRYIPYLYICLTVATLSLKSECKGSYFFANMQINSSFLRLFYL